MSKKEEDIDSILDNEAFRRWVLYPTSESDRFWERWLLENPEKKEAVKNARIILKSMQFQESELSAKQKSLLLKKIKHSNALREEYIRRETVVRPLNNSIEGIRKGYRKSTVRQLLKYAAILGGAIIIALSAELLLGDVESEPEVQLVKKVNKRGQKSTIFLSDGTVVTLNSSSSLEYPEEFTGNVREVKLVGEAFFKVAHDGKPFIVKMNTLEAKVLGTSFNARAFADKDEFSISLVTGKVEVYPTHDYEKHMVLYPGEKATLATDTKGLLKSFFNYEQEILWKDGILVFSKMPFKEALQSMEKWYGVDFNVDSIPEESLVTGTFNNESLEVVLRSISFTLRFDYDIVGNKINIKFKK